MTRGTIRNRAYAQQIRDFSGLRFGSITPTDIDGFFEIAGRVFVFIEAKHGASQMPRGQRLAMERLVDAIHSPPNRYAAAFIASHNTDGDIDFGSAPVTMVRYEGRWHHRPGNVSLKASIDASLLFAGADVGA